MNKLVDYSLYGDEVALISDNGIEVSYSSITQYSQELSAFLKPRSLLFCLCNNEVGSMLGYLSFLEQGVVPVMLDASKDLDLLNKLLRLYKPSYIWLPSSIYSPEYGEIKYVAFNYVLTSFCDESIDFCSELALLLTTSGSTGSPKLVRLSYDNVRSNAESIAEYLNITSDERPITSLPMYYSYGLSVINSHLIKGATILLTDKPVIQKEFWAFAKEQKATSIAGVPYTYEMLKRLRIFRMDLPELKTMTQAGGKLNANLAQEYIEQATASGKKFVVMYGQTEATARMSYLPVDKALEKYSSIGIAIPGGKFSLIDVNGQEITEPEVDGELVYTGRNVSLGYAECRADLAKGDENHGVLHTGDIACRDVDGFYYITGRMKRFVKIYGNRVNLDATEQLVKEITTSCACVGVDDKITVFITESDKAEAIKSLLVKKTGLNVRAFAVQTIDNIPKNPAGKVQYAELSNLINEC